MGRTFRLRKHKKGDPRDEVPLRDLMVESLCNWMTTKGWTAACKMRPFVFSETGRGLQALHALHADHVIVSIPEQVVITCRRVLNSSWAKIFEDTSHPSFPTAQQILTTFLALEKRIPDSEWATYISSIPNQFYTPLFCHDLQNVPSYLSEKVMSEAKRLEESLSWVNSQLQKTQIEKLSWQEYLWAWYAVNTRAVYVEPSVDRICKDKDSMALAPFLDLLNHSPHIKPNKVNFIFI